MAVTVTVAELAAAMRLGATSEETAEATRLLAYATEAISRHLGGAYEDVPAAVVNEAAIRLAGYIYDQPTTAGGPSYANALRNSGAAAMLLPYRIHRAGSTADALAAAQEAVGTAANPVTNISVSVTDGTITITFADGTTRTEALPAGTGEAPARPMPATPGEAEGGTSTTIRSWTAALIRAAINAVVPPWARAGDETPIPGPKLANAPSGGGGIDQTARDAAAGAQGTADGAQTAADAAQGAADRAATRASNADGTANLAQADIDAHEATAHNTDTTARDAATAAADAANQAQNTGLNALATARTALATADGKAAQSNIDAAVAAHATDPDAHHAPPADPGGGGTAGYALERRNANRAWCKPLVRNSD